MHGQPSIKIYRFYVFWKDTFSKVDYKILFLMKDNKFKNILLFNLNILVQIHKVILICTVGKMTLCIERK